MPNKRLLPLFFWRLPYPVVAAAIASVPFYGYFVHAASDPQQIALLIFLCWFLTWAFLIGLIVLYLILPPSSFIIRLSAVFLIMYLLIAGIIGWGGVKKAFFELLAG